MTERPKVVSGVSLFYWFMATLGIPLPGLVTATNGKIQSRQLSLWFGTALVVICILGPLLAGFGSRVLFILYPLLLFASNILEMMLFYKNPDEWN